jgi:hypothetical protein
VIDECGGDGATAFARFYELLDEFPEAQAHRCCAAFAHVCPPTTNRHATSASAARDERGFNCGVSFRAASIGWSTRIRIGRHLSFQQRSYRLEELMLTGELDFGAKRDEWVMLES